MNLKPVLFGVTIGIALYAGLLAADCNTVCAAPLAILVGIWYFCIAAGRAASANRDAVQGKVARVSPGQHPQRSRVQRHRLEQT